jgi:CubicO group peptidase (beta-lactamase class C family)
MSRALLWLALTIPFFPATGQSPARLDAIVRVQRDSGFSGVALVARGDSVIFEKSYSQPTSKPVTLSTKFNIASMTKAFTATLVLQQAARGRINLDSPAIRYWPEFPDPSKGGITIRHLLTHRSGLKHWGAVSGFLEGPARLTQRPSDVVALYAAKGLSFPPGAQEDYSSLGYVALGIILEKITGESYASLLEREILKPLGMTSTSLDDGASILPGRTRPYRYNFLKARYDNAEYRDPSTSFSAGGIVATADDLLRWSEALSTNRLLSDSLRALIFDRVEGDA